MALSTYSKVLAGIRMAVGVSSWATPTLAGQSFGIRPDDNQAGPYLGRLFGVRDVALAGGVLAAPNNARRLWLQAGLACDVADVAAALLAVRSGSLSRSSGVLAGGVAAAAAAIGVLALWTEDVDPDADPVTTSIE